MLSFVALWFTVCVCARCVGVVVAGNPVTVESASNEAWQCVQSGAACSCAEQVKQLNEQRKLCDYGPADTLVDLVKASCGSGDDGSGSDSGAGGGSRAMVCDQCASLTDLATSMDCKTTAQNFCSGTDFGRRLSTTGSDAESAATTFCDACFPNPTLSCGTAFYSACSDCNWGAWMASEDALAECLEDKAVCECTTLFHALQGHGTNCPLPPAFMQEQFATCDSLDTCDQDAMTAAGDRMKDCVGSKPLCRCVVEFEDYKAAATDCGRPIDAATAEAAEKCTDGVACLDGVQSAYTSLLVCQSKQANECDCKPRFAEWKELATACGLTPDAEVVKHFSNCAATGDSTASFVEFTSATFLAKEVDGTATVALRRFGGTGAKAQSMASVGLAVYSSEGAFTGVTAGVQWDQGDMDAKSVDFNVAAGALQGVASFTVEIIDATNVVFGELDATSVTVQPKPVPKEIALRYPSGGVVWRANSTRHVTYSTTGFDSSATFNVDLFNGVTKVQHIGVGGTEAKLFFTIDASLPEASTYTVAVQQVSSSRRATSSPFTIEQVTVTPPAWVRVSVQPGASPLVAWLGSSLTAELAFHSNNDDDEVAVVVSDVHTGAFLDLVGRWDVDDAIPSTLVWEVPFDMPTSANADFQFEAFLLVENDFIQSASTAFAVQPPVALSTSAWGTCSATCGVGVQYRNASCVDVSAAGTPAAPLGVCLLFHTLPTTARRCFNKPCAAYGWSTGAWGECSRTCGSGEQARTVTCVDSANIAVDGSQCTGTRPASKRACADLPKCETYSWDTSRWLPCSKKCGGGSQFRLVDCVGDQGTPNDDGSLCSGSPKPDRRQACNTDPCPTFRWAASRWSKCSAQCDGGNQTRTVRCINSADGSEASPVLCTDSVPATQRDCNTARCPDTRVAWKYGAWSECNKACGGGNSTRDAVCVNAVGEEVASQECFSRNLPRKAKAWCNTQPCDPCAALQCANGGTCIDGRCNCTAAYKGDLCLTPASCSGRVAKDGECCASGVVAHRTAECCVPSGAATPVLDRSGKCCASGVLDACQVCNGDGVGYDRRGVCCSGAGVAVDEAGVCCSRDRIDACGVCDGDGLSCMVKLRLRVRSRNYTTAQLLVAGSLPRCVFPNQVPRACAPPHAMCDCVC